MRDKQRKLQLRSSPSHACMQEGDCVTAADEQRESGKAELFLTCLSHAYLLIAQAETESKAAHTHTMKEKRKKL